LIEKFESIRLEKEAVRQSYFYFKLEYSFVSLLGSQDSQRGKGNYADE